MKKYILAGMLWMTALCGHTQIIWDSSRPHFEWILPLADVPFMKDAAQAVANRRTQAGLHSPASIRLADYGNFFRNLSMNPGTEMARNLHGSLYYINNKLWYKWIPPAGKKRYIWNRILANITALGTDYLATRLPYGYAFQHEEFHRAVMSARGIYSYDEVWKFGKGFDIAVTQVKDEDLIYLKKHHPADMVRLSAAGVEGEYAYLKRMREDNFFKHTGYPFVGLNILGTFHAINYVNLPFKKRFNAITDSILAYDKNNILARDFTGYDFSAWVYDLHRSNEPYEARGTWPGGIGIKRPVKETDLTPGMKKFLRETGNVQYLNLLSPFLLGINKFKLNEKLSANFALRSVPTSFGYYAGADLFIEKNDKKMLLSLGVHRSCHLSLPDLALKYYDIELLKNKKLSADVFVSGWLQPKDQRYYAKKATAGFAINIEPNVQLSNNIKLVAGISYKSKGWLFAHPYLDNNLGGMLQLKIGTG